MKRTYGLKWGMPLSLVVIAMMIFSLASLSSFAQTPEPNSPEALYGAQVISEAFGDGFGMDTTSRQFPTPAFNPNKITPTPAAGGQQPPVQQATPTTGAGVPVQPTAPPAAPSSGGQQQSGGQSENVDCPILVDGQPLTGTVTNEVPSALFCLAVAQGDVINLEMVATSGNLDPYLMIYDLVAEQVVAENDDIANGNLSAGITNFTVPAANVYVVLATRAGANQGTSTGNFNITFTTGAGGSNNTGTTNTNTGSVGTGGLSFTCPDGNQFVNGVMVTVVQMRAGFTYNATAIGIDGFDPVLGVLDASGNILCSDDTASAAVYSAALPSIQSNNGVAPASASSARVDFFHNDPSGFANIGLIVAGFNNASGEFILVLEGMAVTSADGAGGDPFAVHLTPNLLNSNVPIAAYQISNTTSLDPMMYVTDIDGNVLTDTSGTEIYCDDAGTEYCWGESVSLNNAAVTILNGRGLPGGPSDPMLFIQPGLAAAAVAEMQLEMLLFRMTSYQQSSFADYTVVFHLGIGQ